jgi:hypothetical protein
MKRPMRSAACAPVLLRLLALAAAASSFLLVAAESGGAAPHPTMSFARFSEDGRNQGLRYTVTVSVRFRLCGAAQGSAVANVEESQHTGGSAPAHGSFARPFTVASGKCASYRVAWPLDERFFGAGKYSVSVLVRDAHGAVSNAAAHDWLTSD